MRRLPHLIATACCAVLLAGCGGGSDNNTDNPDAGGESTTEPTSATPTSDTPTSDTTDDTTGDGGDGCSFASDADLSAAVGADVVNTNAGDGGCTFKLGDATFLISLTLLGIDQQTYIDGTRDGCDGPITDVDTGDAAFACETMGRPTGFVFSGGEIYTLQELMGDDITMDQVVAMLPAINT